jgi:hypothetical protein
MADGAAHLVDRVLPPCADVRQWTLSLPRWLRFRLLCEPDLVSDVLRIFVRAVSAYHRRRARLRGVADGQTGAVTSIQRAAMNVQLRGTYLSRGIAAPAIRRVRIHGGTSASVRPLCANPICFTHALQRKDARGDLFAELGRRRADRG